MADYREQVPKRFPPVAGLSRARARAEAEKLRRRAGGPVRYVVEPKFDGFSVEVVYREGVFERAATRGDGRVGEDISRNLATVRALPLRLRGAGRAPALLAVRGEVFLRRRGFRELNRRRIETGEEPLANPRNAAAGMMRQLDSSRLAGLPFDVVFYELLRVEGREPTSQRETLAALAGWGLATDRHNRVVRTLREVERLHAHLLAEREQLSYELDGIVIKVDDFALRARVT